MSTPTRATPFKKRYDFILDLYPLLAEFPPEGVMLAFRMEQSAFEILTEPKALEEFRLLLKMARDLGYLDDRLYFFLDKRVGMLG